MFFCLAVVDLCMSTAHAQTLTAQEQRIARLESRVHQLEDPSPSRNADIGGVSILFGAFCALWAQNTRRNAWLWFFLGLLFSAITVIVLLVKNSNDRDRRDKDERFRRMHPPGSAPVSPPS
jgi:hypothetical protein